MLELIAFSGFVELVAIVIIFVCAILVPSYAIALIHRFEHLLGRMGLRRGLSTTLLAFLAFGLSIAFSLAGRLPQPIAHDEFGYLLSADTFAHGRLTNPTHPMWMHFESFHIIQQPTYNGKYPPGQSLMLALGQIIVHPIVGVWISTALAAAAVYWMLLAWVPPWLAFLGGLITVLHPALLLIWGQIYWGGQVAVIGSALIFGALRRIMRRPRILDGILMGIGLAVLASRRPFEGFVAVLPAAIVLLHWMFSSNGPALIVSVRRVVLPVALILAAATCWTGYYNWRVTGDPLKLPYMVYESTYGVVRFFTWQQARELPSYRHKVMKDFYQGELDSYSEQAASGFAAESFQKLTTLWLFYNGMRALRLPLLLPLLALPWLWRNRWTEFLLVTFALFISALLILTWRGAHYAPPIVPIVVALGLQGARNIRLWCFGKIPVGRFLMWSLAIVAVMSFVAMFAAALVDKLNDRDPSWHFERARLNEELGRQGRHLIIVRYGPNHDPYQEWVYNQADIDGASVVWAREMDPAENMKLIDYFKDRKIWLLNVGNDELPPRLVPFISDGPH